MQFVLVALLAAVASAAPGYGPSYGNSPGGDGGNGGEEPTYYCTTGQLSCCQSTLNLGGVLYSGCSTTFNTPAQCTEAAYLCCTLSAAGECVLPHQPTLCTPDSTDTRCVTVGGGN